MAAAAVSFRGDERKMKTPSAVRVRKQVVGVSWVQDVCVEETLASTLSLSLFEVATLHFDVHLRNVRDSTRADALLVCGA